MARDEQFLVRRLRVPPDALDSERRRELLEAAATRSLHSSHSAWERLRESGWPLVQTAVAATVAWAVAANLLGHRSPFFAPIAAIVSLAATRGQRARRAVELIVGVAIGIGVGELLTRAIGIGVGQLALIVGLAMAAAVLLGAGRLLLTEAAVSATLVATVSPATRGFPPTRLLDALIGGAVALLFSQLLFPVHPVRIVREAAESVVGELAQIVSAVAAALEHSDLPAAEEALVKARRVSSDWARFEQALDVGREAARYAPPRRRQREAFTAYREAGLPLDLLVRDVHVLARGVVRALMIEDPISPGIAQALRDLAAAIQRLTGELGHEREGTEARKLALRAAYAATELAPDENISASVLVGYTQATAADILRSLGVDRETAHARIGQAAQAARS